MSGGSSSERSEEIRAAVALLAGEPDAADGTVDALAFHLESLGQPAVVVTAAAAGRGAHHRDVRRLIPRGAFRATVSLLMRNRRLLAKTAAGACGDLISRPADLIRTLRALPRAIAIAEQLASHAIAHVHTTADPAARTLALLAAQLSGTTVSVASAGGADGSPRLRDAEVVELRNPAGASERTAAALIELLDRKRYVTLRPLEQALIETAAGCGLTVTALRRLHVRPDSLIGEVTIRDGATVRDLVLKQHRTREGESRPADARASHEFEVMTRLRRTMETRCGKQPLVCSVPRPLQTDPARGVVVMERAAGTALDQLMSAVERRREVPALLGAPVQAAGTWLRLMQESTRSEREPGKVVHEIARIARRDLDTVARADRKVSRSREAIARSIDELAGRTVSTTTMVTGRHCDYWPGNIFIDATRVEVIDFEAFRDGLPLEDVAYFLIFLELMFPRFGGRVPELHEAFRAGYAPYPIDGTSLAFSRLTASLQILARLSFLPGHSPLLLWSRWRLRRIVLGSIR